METATVLLDHNDGKHFDERLKKIREAGVREVTGTTQFIQKKGATSGGRSGVLITFDVVIDGKRYPVQAAMTANNFLMAASAIKGAVADEQ